MLAPAGQASLTSKLADAAPLAHVAERRARGAALASKVWADDAMHGSITARRSQGKADINATSAGLTPWWAARAQIATTTAIATNVTDTSNRTSYDCLMVRPDGTVGWEEVVDMCAPLSEHRYVNPYRKALWVGVMAITPAVVRLGPVQIGKIKKSPT